MSRKVWSSWLLIPMSYQFSEYPIVIYTRYAIIAPNMNILCQKMKVEFVTRKTQLMHRRAGKTDYNITNFLFSKKCGYNSKHIVAL